MFHTISLGNFKSFARLDPIRLSKLVGLFGANSSGKSSLIQSLLLMKQTLESTDRYRVFDFGDESSSANLGGFKEAVHGHDTNCEMKLGIRFALPEILEVHDASSPRQLLLKSNWIDFETTIAATESGDIGVTHIRYLVEGGEFSLAKLQEAGEFQLKSKLSSFKFLRSSGRKWPLPSPIKFHGFPDETYTYFVNASFLARFQLALETKFKNTFYLGPLRDFPRRDYPWKKSEPADMGRRGEKVVDALLASRERGQYLRFGRGNKSRSLEEHVAHWLKDLGLIHSFELVQSNLRGDQFEVQVRKNIGSPAVQLTDVGFGVSQLLPILVLCFYVPEGSTVILEQPEIHLHPAVQSQLADVFLEAIEIRKIQIIVESHSEHLLRRVQRRVAEGTAKAEDVSLMFVRNNENDSYIDRLKVNAVGAIENWPDKFFGDPFNEVAETHKAALQRTKG